MKQIMIVEDDIGLNDGIEMALKGADYCFLKCYTFKEAEKYLEAGRPDMVLLDVNLPDGSGYELLKKIRSGSELPVILLTANDMETDEVMGLSLGADDYITKPFSLMVLRARIENLFRRSKTMALAVFELDDLYLDFSCLVFKKGENELVLSKTEQKLLRTFLENRGRILSRNTLLEKIWGTDQYVDENALSVVVNRLRNKLESHGQTYIKTIYGTGYLWEKRDRDYENF